MKRVKASPAIAVGRCHRIGTTVRKASEKASDPAAWPLGNAYFPGKASEPTGTGR